MTSVQRTRTTEFYSWTWKLTNKDDSECCGICQQRFGQCCSTCQHPRECPPCLGVCQHLFHKHCMERWILRQKAITDDPPHCPMCRQVWSYHSK